MGVVVAAHLALAETAIAIESEIRTEIDAAAAGSAAAATATAPVEAAVVAAVVVAVAVAVVVPAGTGTGGIIISQLDGTALLLTPTAQTLTPPTPTATITPLPRLQQIAVAACAGSRRILVNESETTTALLSRNTGAAVLPQIENPSSDALALHLALLTTQVRQCALFVNCLRRHMIH